MLVLPVFSSSIKVLLCLQSIIEEEKTGNSNFTLKTQKDFNRRRKDWQYQHYSEDTKGLWYCQSFLLRLKSFGVFRVKMILSVFSSSIKVIWCLQRSKKKRLTIPILLWRYQRTLIEEEKTDNINFTLKTPKDFNRRRKDWQYQLCSEDTKGLD
jgi:uncharacterized short protein YbdD (DUF466 family)